MDSKDGSKVSAIEGRLQVLYVADSASQLGPARILAEGIIEGRNAELVPVICTSGAVPSAGQRDAAGIIDAPIYCTHSEFTMSPRYTSADVVVAMLPGTRLLQLRLELEERMKREGLRRRPVLVTGYNGVVYEYQMEGFLWRVGYDVICLNSSTDYCSFSTVCAELGMSTDPLCVTGLMLAQNSQVQIPHGEPIRTVLFAPQAIVPRRRDERVYILERLVQYARRFPDREVIIKPRTAPGERTFHVERFHYAQIFDEEFDVRLMPPNLKFAYGPLSALLGKADLVLSVSSSAVLEALASGVRAGIIADFGFRERHGTHYFLTSGLAVTFDEVIDDNIPRARVEWLADHGFGGGASLKNAALAVNRMLERQSVLSECSPLQPVFYSEENAPFVYAQVLGRAQRERVSKGRSRSSPSKIRRKVKKLIRDPVRFFKDIRRK